MLLALLFILFLITAMYFVLQSNSILNLKLHPKLLLSALLFKTILATLFWYSYTNHLEDRKSADQYKYFDDAVYLNQALNGHTGDKIRLIFNLPLKEINQEQLIANTLHWDRSKSEAYNDNPFIIKIHLILLTFTNGSFALHALFFGSLSFFGCLGILVFFKQESAVPIRIFATALFFYPSFVFWTSGVLKETLVIFLIGCFLYLITKLRKAIYLKIPLSILLVYLLSQIKPYLIIAIAPALFYFIIRKVYPHKNLLAFILSQSFIFTAYAYLFFNRVAESILKKQNAFIDLAKESNASTFFSSSMFESSSDIIIYSPTAIANTFLRPFPWQIDSYYSALFSIENILLVIASAIAILYRRSLTKRDFPIFYMCLSTSILLAVLIGWSTPVWGALVRYKALLIPFYLGLILSFVDIQKIPFINRYETFITNLLNTYDKRL